ncbi:MAG TPA: hypothetical protein VEG39_01465 [Clostridia bacterium]|nr:hypothetical protein [Clostridia bacterium]
MGLRDLGIPRESIEQIAAACKKLYLKSRTLDVSHDQQDLLLNNIIEELIKDASTKLSNEGKLPKENSISLEEYQEKVIAETKKLIDKNRKKLDLEASYLSLKELQGSANLLMQYEKDNIVQEEREPSIDFVIDCLKNMNGETNSFCILSDNTISYIQCAGSTDRLAIEYRKYEGIEFKHYIIGHKKLFKNETTVYFSGRNMPVKTNEIFNLVGAIEMFESFYNKKGIPKGYALRNVSNKMNPR